MVFPGRGIWLIGVEYPNVLLILSDDRSVPHAGCHGDENCKRFINTPNLNALIADELEQFDLPFISH